MAVSVVIDSPPYVNGKAQACLFFSLLADVHGDAAFDRHKATVSLDQAGMEGWTREVSCHVCSMWRGLVMGQAKGTELGWPDGSAVS